jgi:MFS family permease
MDTQNRLSTIGLATVLLGAFLAIADFFIVNVALPTIATDLHPSTATLQLVVAGYGIPYALTLVLGGRLGDLYGRRPLFMAGVVSFTLFSLLCGIAPTAPVLIAFRAAQGVSAALMVPQVLATIQSTSHGQARARAIGLYGATAGIAAVVGQIAGGLIVDANVARTGWRLIFLVNVPVGIVALLLAHRHVPASRSTEPPRVDVPGTALLGITVLALLVPLTEGRSLGWPAWSIALLALVVPAAAAFTVVERRLERGGRHPLVPPSMLRDPGMRAGLAIAALFFSGFAAFMFASAIAFQTGAHLTPIGSGLAVAPLALAFFATTFVTPQLMERFGRSVIAAGALVQAVGLVGVALTLRDAWPNVDALTLAPAMIVAGIGQGLLLPPLFGFVLAGVPAARAGVGAGILTTTMQSALALGVATLGSVFLSYDAAGSLGMRDAFVLVLAVQTVAALLVSVAVRGLPEPAKARAEAERAAAERAAIEARLVEAA